MSNFNCLLSGVYGNALDAHGEKSLLDSDTDDDKPAEDEKSRLLKKKKEVRFKENSGRLFLHSEKHLNDTGLLCLIPKVRV